MATEFGPGRPAADTNPVAPHHQRGPPKDGSVLIQEQLRQIGIRLELQPMEFPLWVERRTAGKFDIDFGSTVQDPSPAA